MVGLFPGFDSGGCAVVSVEDGDVLDFGLVGGPGDPLHRGLGFPEGGGQLPGLIADHPFGFDLGLPGRRAEAPARDQAGNALAGVLHLSAEVVGRLPQRGLDGLGVLQVEDECAVCHVLTSLP